MKLHDRYFLREIMGPLLLWTAAVVMMRTLQELFGVMDLLVAHRFPMESLWQYLFYKLPMMVQWSLPVALLLGSSLAVSRLQHDTELTAMRIAGLPLWRFLAPVAAVGLLLSLVSRYMGEYVVPPADHQAEAIHRKMTFESQVTGFVPDTFFRSENRIFYFHTSYAAVKDRAELQGVVVYQLNGVIGKSSNIPDRIAPGQPGVFWTAEHAQVRGEIWTLTSVIQHNMAAGGEITGDVALPSLQFNLHRNIQFFLNNQQTPQELTSRELASRIHVDERLSLPASVILPLRYEYGFRSALPFACLVFALVGAPLTLRFARGGSLVGILVAFGVIFFYYDIMVIAQKLAISGALAPEPAAWVANILFACLGLYLAWNEGGS